MKHLLLLSRFQWFTSTWISPQWKPNSRSLHCSTYCCVCYLIQLHRSLLNREPSLYHCRLHRVYCVVFATFWTLYCLEAPYRHRSLPGHHFTEFHRLDYGAHLWVGHPKLIYHQHYCDWHTELMSIQEGTSSYLTEYAWSSHCFAAYTASSWPSSTIPARTFSQSFWPLLVL